MTWITLTQSNGAPRTFQVELIFAYEPHLVGDYNAPGCYIMADASGDKFWVAESFNDVKRLIGTRP